MSTDRPMPWPHPPDYNEAVQVPQQSFQDAELRLGSPALNALGLPWPRSGSSADVYKIVCPGDQAWAVKCFTLRCPRTARALSGGQRLPRSTPHAVPRRGPLSGAGHPRTRPLVPDRQDALGRRPAARTAWPANMPTSRPCWNGSHPCGFDWRRRCARTRIVHGDLQHGNVLLVPEDREGHLRLRLVDYDGLTVPGLEASPSGELGHPNYQHPQRRSEGDGGAEADRFAHLVIYTGLRALAVGGRALGSASTIVRTCCSARRISRNRQNRHCFSPCSSCRTPTSAPWPAI